MITTNRAGYMSPYPWLTNPTAIIRATYPATKRTLMALDGTETKNPYAIHQPIHKRNKKEAIQRAV
jgi:hypothetical protein